MMQLAVLLAAACGVGVAAGDKAWLEGPAPLPSAFDHLKHRHADRISRKLATCHPDYDLAKIEGLLSSTHESCASTEASVRVGCSTQQRQSRPSACVILPVHLDSYFLTVDNSRRLNSVIQPQLTHRQPRRERRHRGLLPGSEPPDQPQSCPRVCAAARRAKPEQSRCPASRA